MVSNDSPERILDPVEMLNECLERAWNKICDAYDASASLPEIHCLFEQADLSKPVQAAETVLVNMLLEVMEYICRFSPWYTKPARAFGLYSVRDSTANRIRWMLAPEAAQKWACILQPLQQAIEKYNGLIQAFRLVDDLMARTTPEDPIVTASCSCIPPRAIQIRYSVLIKAEIICDRCRQPYLL
jgi:hypothetical protein